MSSQASAKPGPAHRPLVIFDGNCQAHHLAAIFDASGLAEGWVNGADYGTAPAFRGRLARYADEATCIRLGREARRAGRPVIQATQSTPWSEMKLTAYTDEVDQVVRFPYLHCGIYQRGENAPGKAAALRRAYEADLEVVAQCQGAAGSRFDFAGFIAAEQASRPLFHMHVHPGPALMSALVSDLGSGLGCVDEIALGAVASEMAATEGINVWTQHPLPAGTRDALGFAWGEGYDAYGALIEDRARRDWPEIVRRRSERECVFAADTQFWCGLFDAGIGLGSIDLAREAFDEVVRRSPGVPELWAAMHGFDRARRPELVDRAVRVFAGSRLLYYVLSRTASQDGDHATALRLGHWHQEAAEDLDDGFVPLSLAFKAAGRMDEAAANAAEFAAARPEPRRSAIVTIMRHHELIRPDPGPQGSEEGGPVRSEAEQMILDQPEPEQPEDAGKSGGYAQGWRPAFEFDADGLATAHDSSFLRDPRFQEAYAFGLTVPTSLGADLHIEWRAWIAIWAAEQALLAPGDFIECGVYTGILSGTICRWTNFADRPSRRFWLVDTFEGLPEEQVLEAEKTAGLLGYNSEYVGRDVHDEVVRKFSVFPNVRVVRGRVPEALEAVEATSVAYLSLDMNIAVPEMAALDHFWPLLSPGGVILIDDYNWKAHAEQRARYNAFSRHVGVPILGLPTGQGLIVKPAGRALPE